MVKRHRIVLIRHGKTKGNTENRYIGCHSDEPVSEEGIELLKQADRSRIPHCDRLFCGPMQRCVTTAKYLFPDREAEVVSDMTEMDFGLYEGKNYEELKEDPYYISWMESGGRLPFPEGEDMAGFVRRSMKAFRGILARLSDGESAVIVCHGGNIMSIMSALTGGEYFDFGPHNGEGYETEIACDGETIVLVSYAKFECRGSQNDKRTG